MKKMLWGLIGLLCFGTSTVYAGAQINIPDPAGIYAQGVITLDAPGTVVWNSRAIDTFYHPYVLSGDCVIDIFVNSFTNQKTPIGFTCATAGAVHITTTGALTAYCPSDGGILQGLRLTLSLDGTVFYDKELWPSNPPQVCYLTAAPYAAKAWNAPVGSFDNSTVGRTSATTTLLVQDSSWLYSQHTFTGDAGVVCSSYRLNFGTRFKQVWKEVGFKCEAAVPAYTKYTVTVQ
jgi:hypothetical protein